METVTNALREEFQAILHGVAMAPITDRAFLRITGTDATRWLNGMVTNSIQSLAPGEGNYNFLLNAQGRIQGDCTIYREPREGDATFLLVTENSQIETIHQLLDKFIIMDDVEVTRVMSAEEGTRLLGPESETLLREANVEAGAPLTLSEVSSVTGNTTRVLSPFFQVLPDFELFGHGFDFGEAKEASSQALEAFRIYAGRPKFGIDIREKDLPQETAQTHALHFAKGCYLGQEIVERIRSRGQVHRTFVQFALDGDIPTLPAPLEASIKGQTKAAGELTSAALVPLDSGDQILALGYVRREFLNLPLSYPGGTASVYAKPEARN